MALTDPSGTMHIEAQWVGRRPAIALPRRSQGIGKWPFSPNLLAASKTVRGEAFGFLYHQPFVFRNPTALLEFMLPMTPATVAQLRDIALENYDSKIRTALGGLVLLRGAVGLRKLRLLGRLRSDTYEICYKTDALAAQTLATRFYDLFHPFIRTFIAQHGVDALMGVVEFAHLDLHCLVDRTAVPTAPDSVAWKDERKKWILAKMKEHIASWVKKSPKL